YVTVDLRGDYQTEGTIIAIDNYLNLVLENENGLETIKGGNIIFISLKED
ncbi:MAG: LSM domain protein, partial [Methanobrevibacter sp.]|nr:LSM domain protein [Methanobrevibacter sp.]